MDALDCIAMHRKEIYLFLSLLLPAGSLNFLFIFLDNIGQLFRITLDIRKIVLVFLTLKYEKASFQFQTSFSFFLFLTVLGFKLRALLLQTSTLPLEPCL
jgi:hypothetical protein